MASQPNHEPSMLNRVKSLFDAGHKSKALYVLYREVDSLLDAKDIQKVRDLLRSAWVLDLELTVLVGLLTATLQCATPLPERKQLFRIVQLRAGMELGIERAERILRGLEFGAQLDLKEVE